MILTRSISSYHWRCIARNAAGDAAYFGRRGLAATCAVLRVSAFGLVAVVAGVLVMGALGLRHVLWRIDPNLLYEIEHDGPAG